MVGLVVIDEVVYTFMFVHIELHTYDNIKLSVR